MAGRQGKTSIGRNCMAMVPAEKLGKTMAVMPWDQLFLKIVNGGSLRGTSAMIM